MFRNWPRGEGNCAAIERQKLSRGNFCLAASRCLSGPSGHDSLCRMPGLRFFAFLIFFDFRSGRQEMAENWGESKGCLIKGCLNSGVAPANQTKERSVHELFAGAFRNKSSMWIVLVFLRKKHQNSQKRANFMNFLFWPFLWFGLPGRLLMNSTKIPKVGIPKTGIPKVGIPKTGIPKAGIPKVGKTHTGTLPETELSKARDSEVRDSENRDSESRDSENRDSENGQIHGPLNSDTP